MYEPQREFRAAASAAGVIRPGDPLDARLIDFAHRIVERCACVPEPFSDHDHSAVRAEFGKN